MPSIVCTAQKISGSSFQKHKFQSEFKNLIPRSISHRRTIKALKGYRSTLLTGSGIPWCKSDRPLCKTERAAQLGSVCAAQASFSRDLPISFVPVNYISMFRRQTIGPVCIYNCRTTEGPENCGCKSVILRGLEALS
jgi:hypothetical protein